VGKSAASNWFELARHPTSELGRKPHTLYKFAVTYMYAFISTQSSNYISTRYRWIKWKKIF